MPKPGRKSIPTAVKRLRGNPGKRPLNGEEPQAEQATARLPYGRMEKRAANLWRRVAGPLIDAGLLKEIDTPALEMMCHHYALALDALAVLLKDGIVSKDERGLPRKHPLAQVFREESAAFRQYAELFGMTPSSRSSIHIDAPEKELSLVDELFAGIVNKDE